MPKALIIYFSKSGHTKAMAEAVERGFASAKVETRLSSVTDVTPADMLGVDAIILGSPCYYGSMASEMKSFLDESVKFHGKLAGKVGGAFATSGMLGGGNETSVMSLIEALLIHGMVIKGHARIGHYGPVAIGAPDKAAIDECLSYGKSLAELTLRLSSQ